VARIHGDNQVDQTLLNPRRCVEPHAAAHSQSGRHAHDQPQPFPSLLANLVQPLADRTDEIVHQRDARFFLAAFEVKPVPEEVKLDAVDVVIAAELVDDG